MTRRRRRQQPPLPKWKEGAAAYYANKRAIESGETFRSQKPSNYKRKAKRM